MITDYQYVQASNPKRLVPEVKREISQGWVPLGAPFLAVSVGGVLCQFMIKEG